MAAKRRFITEPGMDSFCELNCPSDIDGISGDLACTVERVHPLRQVMVVLSILVPFQALIRRLIGFAFVQLLSNPKAPHSRMLLSLLLI
ncbi:Uncharacterised protein [uncultured archaeon]|nr:Uncharacterised protein [uncultured archaeon]